MYVYKTVPHIQYIAHYVVMHPSKDLLLNVTTVQDFVFTLNIFFVSIDRQLVDKCGIFHFMGYALRGEPTKALLM